MKNQLKFWSVIFLFGTLVQMLGISLFSSISMTRWSRIGQPISLGLTAIGIVALLSFAFRNRNKPSTVILAGLGFSAAYLLAFHAVGLAIFPGLLRDADEPGYWISLVRVFAVAAIIHTALAVAVFGVKRMGWLGTTRVV